MTMAPIVLAFAGKVAHSYLVAAPTNSKLDESRTLKGLKEKITNMIKDSQKFKLPPRGTSSFEPHLVSVFPRL